MQQPDIKPGNYYVSCRDDNGRTLMLLGPFVNDHAKALSMVNIGDKLAQESGDPKAWFYSYGTCRTDPATFSKPGIFNAKAGLAA